MGIGLSSTTLQICLEGLKGMVREIECKHVDKFLGLNMNLYGYELGVTCIHTDDVVQQITEKRLIAEHCET
jgi:hypothetical protein